MPTQKVASFGEYNCFKCKNKWKSAESYANVGQKCKKCQSVVIATNQRPLKKSKHANTKTEEERNLKGAGPFFGEFNCKKCQKQWFSAYSWFDDDEIRKMSQKCKRCKSNVFAINMRPLAKTESDSTKPHQVHLCAKCKKLGFSCESLKNASRGLSHRYSRFRF